MSSDKFVILNCVRQVSVLSPILFGYYIMYMEDLISFTVKRNIGCKVDDHFTGILVYADDIVLRIKHCSQALQEFYFAHSSTKCSIIHKYCTSLYGCELWDLFCEDFFKLLILWNIYVRKAWVHPRSRHRRYIYHCILHHCLASSI